MWTELRRSRFLLIRIQRVGKHGMIFPVSLTALDQLIKAWLELAEFVSDIFSVILNRKHEEKPHCDLGRGKLKIDGLLHLVRELWEEVRSYGQWEVVRIENDDVRVDVHFY